MTPQLRKSQSENLLRSKNICFDSKLPTIEANFRAHTIEEIARYAICPTLWRP